MLCAQPCVYVIYTYLSQAGGHVCAEWIWLVFCDPFFGEETAALNIGRELVVQSMWHINESSGDGESGLTNVP